MSATLMWEPVIERGKSLSDAAKFFIRDAFQLSSDDITLGADSKEFLLGAKAATADPELKKDLETLLAAIEKHGAVRLWQQY